MWPVGEQSRYKPLAVSCLQKNTHALSYELNLKTELNPRVILCCCIFTELWAKAKSLYTRASIYKELQQF